MTIPQQTRWTGDSTRVLVVDDHTTFSDLLALALSGEPDFECVGTAQSATEALALTAELAPDLVVMDVQLGADDGIALTAQLTERFPELRVVVLTAHTSSDLMQRAADAQACCLLPKDGSLTDLLQVLRSARRGGFVVHPDLLRTLVTKRPASHAQLPPLTRREQEVLQGLAEGKDSRVIARNLGISLNTCRGYVKNLLVKLDAHSQLEAVAIARKHGLIDVGRHS